MIDLENALRCPTDRGNRDRLTVQTPPTRDPGQDETSRRYREYFGAEPYVRIPGGR